MHKFEFRYCLKITDIMNPTWSILTVKEHQLYTVQNDIGEKMFSEKSLTSFHGKKKKTQAITVSSLCKLYKLCVIQTSHKGINEMDLHISSILFHHINSYFKSSK